MPRGKRPTGHRAAFSLIETILAFVVLMVLFYVLVQVLGSGRRMEQTAGTHLGLQADARRALAAFLRELQEGIVVVRPAPGQTLPYAVVRDKLNRIAFYSLVPSGASSELVLRRDLAAPGKTDRATLLEGVTRATFTALSDGALMLHVVLGSGERRFAFHTEVRLRNRQAVESF